MLTPKHSVLVLGSGIAGLSTALRLAEKAWVTVVCKEDALEGATRYAQGGIASVWSKQDSFEEHKRDTIIAGAGLCHSDIVDLCVREGPKRVQDLIDLGVPFTRADSSNENFDLHREGGHQKHRILHADDLTGLAIMKTLYERARAHSHIKILENHIAIDLITEGKVFKRWRKSGRCLGAYVLNHRTGEILTLAADVTVLATGGAGKVYLYTTNPDTSTGDGIAMAFRAGAQVMNLEFMQFHPTCLFHPNAKNFLITEALRGDGAVLKNRQGEEFMSKYHPMASLAPRDVVARAIDMEMKKSGVKHVFLDARGIGEETLKRKFPNIFETCLRFGMDITRESIPVVPAAHYTCGGVYADSWGRTTLDGLYALGEVSCTGLHGANRLASNSLLEAAVFADRVAQDAEKYFLAVQARGEMPKDLPKWDSGRAVPLEELLDIASTWMEIRTLMWHYVGIVRSDRRLERAKRRLAILKNEVTEYYWDYLLTKDLIELRNILTVADLIVQCASFRKESRGLHYTTDYPDPNDQFYLRDTVL